MSEPSPILTTFNRRKNGSCCIYPPNFDVVTSTVNDNNAVSKDDQKQETQANMDDYVTREAHHQRQKDTQSDLSKPPVYTRVHSDSAAGLMANTRRLKRALSAAEIKTRLTCPKGLLITTEPPKSGEFYRRRSQTEVFGVRGPRSNSFNNNDFIPLHRTVAYNTSVKEKESLLIQLEAVKTQRDELEKENERLHEELENRNQVIDHLIDYMKSIVTRETNFMDDVSALSSNDSDKVPSSRI